ncbi:MAG: cytochrome C [Betaproteobacteria bacterium RIFCSPLOWO2_02_FULL_67_19]|jgi:nitric oxide reductase subunit C|nr:MAG: cytochrome C [Betaproteobacteria bacterium RIFCSPLOWO2_02_FULL_67_19]
MDQPVWWSSGPFWRKTAVWVTGASLVALVFLSIDSLRQISVGSPRVPAYTVINQRIDYVFDEVRRVQQPRIGAQQPLFGQILNAQQAEALVRHGKLTVQAKNCMDCHTLLGNGAYFAPDLTKAWLDPYWETAAVREQQMVEFLLDPTDKLHNALGRRMPNLHLTQDEAKAVTGFLKWMSSIDTNGFPYNFTSIKQES